MVAENPPILVVNLGGINHVQPSECVPVYDSFALQFPIVYNE